MACGGRRARVDSVAPMLPRTRYDRRYVAACRESVGAAVEELQRVGAGSAAWNQLVPALDRWFGIRNPKVEGRDGVPALIERYLAGEIDVAPFISHRLTLDEVNRGFELMEAQDGIRSVIEFA